MDKKAYMTPDMEVVKMNYQPSLLSGSDDSKQTGGLDDEYSDDPE